MRASAAKAALVKLNDLRGLQRPQQTLRPAQS